MSGANWTGMSRAAAEALKTAPRTPINTAATAREINEGVQPLQNGAIGFDPKAHVERSVEGEGADIMYRNIARANETTRTVMEKLNAILEDGKVDPFTGKRTGKSVREAVGDDDEEDSEAPLQESYEDDDFIAPIKAKAAPRGSWAVIDMMGKNPQTGVKIPVWQVQDEARGVEVPHVFRIQEAALMACEYLNAGKKDKAKEMVETDKRRYELAKKAKILKESNPAGFRKVMGEIAQINIKLGL